MIQEVKMYQAVCDGCGRPCVAVHAGRLVARFGSCVEAARAMGVSKNQVSRWLHGTNKPRNGWQWFYEDESRKWAELVNQ